MEENILKGCTYMTSDDFQLFFKLFQIIAATCTAGFAVIVAAKIQIGGGKAMPLEFSSDSKLEI